MATPPVPELVRALLAVNRALDRPGVSYAVIGGVAANVRGSARTTLDVDVLVRSTQVALPGALTALANEGAHVDLSDAIREWRDAGLLAVELGRVRVDLLRSVLPAFDHVIARASREQIGGAAIPIADIEGLVLLKLIAFRDRDREDIKALAATRAIDIDWVRSEWAALAPPGDTRFDDLLTLIADAASG